MSLEIRNSAELLTDTRSYRRCSNCKQSLLLPRFSKNQGMCKICHREASRKYRAKYPERHRVYKWRDRDKRRQQALNALGGCCNGCGLPDKRVLQIDHIAGHGHIERGNRSVFLRRVVSYPHWYQLLCANCHAIKTYEGKENNQRVPVN